MSAQKGCTIKIPKFDKKNYGWWKMKMLLFIKAANFLYMDIFKNGPFIPMREVAESTSGTEMIPKHYVPKEVSQWSQLRKRNMN